MCIPHSSGVKKNNGFIKQKKKKHIQRVSQSEFEKGDPNFVDERISKENTSKKKSLCDILFGS